MRSCLLCVAALSSAPAAALEVRGVSAPGAYTVSCDGMKGCHYNLPPPEVPQLLCDDKNGCRYDGVTPPPPPAPKPPPPGQVILKTIFEGLSHVDLSKVPEELAKLNIPEIFAKLPDQLAMLNLPDLTKLPEQLANLKPPDLSKLPEQLGKMLNVPLPTPPAMPAQPALVAQVADHSTGVASFVPDNGMCCVQGSPDYVAKALAKLKVSPIGGGYTTAQTVSSSCEARGYTTGPNPEQCFPEAKLYLSNDHKVNPLSEPMLMAAYAAKHGLAGVAQGMMELCKK